MEFLTRCRVAANKWLAPWNVRVDTLTADRAEMRRLQTLDAARRFESPIFPVLSLFQHCDPSALFAEVARQEKQFAEFAAPPKDRDSYSFANDYFTSPDAEILYAIVRMYKPETIIEVGS